MLHKNSLQKLPKDDRDFNLGAIFDQIKIEDIPKIDFVVATPLVIKNQGETDYCSAYALTSVSEDQEELELLPEYQFYKTKLISGKFEEWGANLRDACKSATKFGSVAVQDFPNWKGKDRNVILNKDYWPEHIDWKNAALHKKETYFEVVGRYDLFDDIIAALWQNKADKRSVLTGCLFRNEWLDAENGIIPQSYSDDGFGHAFKIFGVKYIKGTPYLIAQLSQGDQVGDKGLFYFPREVVNKEIGPFGIFMFKDITREKVEEILDKKEEGLLLKFINLIKKLCGIS